MTENFNVRAHEMFLFESSEAEPMMCYEACVLSDSLDMTKLRRGGCGMFRPAIPNEIEAKRAAKWHVGRQWSCSRALIVTCQKSAMSHSFGDNGLSRV
jgi:hypothetical protein